MFKTTKFLGPTSMILYQSQEQTLKKTPTGKMGNYNQMNKVLPSHFFDKTPLNMPRKHNCLHMSRNPVNIPKA